MIAKVSSNRLIKAGRSSIWLSQKGSSSPLLSKVSFIISDLTRSLVKFWGCIRLKKQCHELVCDSGGDEFQIYRGKEMEAVLDMLPYMRLANLSDPAEMESVSFAQGPVCPVSLLKPNLGN